MGPDPKDAVPLRIVPSHVAGAERTVQHLEHGCRPTWAIHDLSRGTTFVGGPAPLPGG
ncbi:hypothetical protein [Streptomyces lydicus]|uniref:hypothetical protein n=1 Tax=Streptomyces lydicus TaxID=47763 RepID=UPI0013E96FCB|nr:hypothetical protein [Streptomyces lydicus]MCZ1011941.1 hypothetical protein [Streptomyces lydicus]